jgi:hypothetical protein
MALKVLCQANGLTEWKVVNSLSLAAGRPEEAEPRREHHPGGGGWRDDPVNATRACYANLVRASGREVTRMFLCPASLIRPPRTRLIGV